MTNSIRRSCDIAPAALVFGGLLVVLTAAGGTLDFNPARIADEIKVVANEGAFRADDFDLLTACKRISHPSGAKNAELARRCRQTALQTASH